VRTKLTGHLDRPGLLTNEPEDVARAIFQAQRAGKRSIYTKGIWQGIMGIVRLLPESVFLRMKK
jgi:short-subunit dehydrogenase